MITDRKERMHQLIEKLNDARNKYAIGDSRGITDKQYDAYLYELEVLEETTGIHLPNSPVMLVGYPETERKVEHYTPVLSLKDTKDVDELLHFLGEEDGLLSWKLDGISIVLYYENGKLVQALTRGDGHIGRDVTQSVIFMRNVPTQLDTKQKLIVRGEGCISFVDFEWVNPENGTGEAYSNPRSMVIGLVNRTKNPSSLLTYVWFIPHSIIFLEEDEHPFRTRSKQLEYLHILGFRVVPHSLVKNFRLLEEIERYTDDVVNFEFPVDGLVLSIDNIAHGDTRGSTMRYPKHSMAYKWPDVSTLTRVVGMKWSLSETGLLTPVVVLEPTHLEGTIVRQANLHNLQHFKQLGIGVGDTVKIYKANKIIPVVEENLTRSNTEKHPIFCPRCGNPTYSVATDKTEKLYCWNCKAKD